MYSSYQWNQYQHAGAYQCTVQEPAEPNKQPIGSHYLGHMTGYQISANQGPVFPGLVGSYLQGGL